ncbi:coatomer subunit beta'-2-like protein [Anopheles sinensis]|uniref:Coatomer subunit beta'-2-like protein n=1 Tax=Anopheles sinensis TaxID=74873 RepID=A0A084W0W1_ANOSI|nr:coatomer subunit beta'-2-like protein [Anopheles sinensis]
METRGTPRLDSSFLLGFTIEATGKSYEQLPFMRLVNPIRGEAWQHKITPNHRLSADTEYPFQTDEPAVHGALGVGSGCTWVSGGSTRPRSLDATDPSPAVADITPRASWMFLGWQLRAPVSTGRLRGGGRWPTVITMQIERPISISSLL